MLIEGLLMCSGVAFQKVRMLKITIGPDYPRRFFDLAKKSMDTLRSVLSEALYLMGCVACVMGPAFHTLYDTYLEYCLEGITNSKNSQVISAAFDSLAFVSRDSSKLVKDRDVEQKIVPLIFNRMEEAGVQPEEKIALFVDFGDLMIGNYAGVMPHIDGILKKYEEGFLAVVELMGSKDEGRELAISMREKLIESHVCLAHSIFEQGGMSNPRIADWIQKDLIIICEFVMLTCNPDMDPNVEYVLHSVCLIADLVILNKSMLQPVSRNYNLRDLVEILKGMKNLSDSSKQTLAYIESTLFTN